MGSRTTRTRVQRAHPRRLEPDSDELAAAVAIMNILVDERAWWHRRVDTRIAVEFDLDLTDRSTDRAMRALVAVGAVQRRTVNQDRRLITATALGIHAWQNGLLIPALTGAPWLD